jgi:hypothetical protein
VIVILSPTYADREDGEWVIWMSHLAPDFGNIKTNTHIIDDVTREFHRFDRHHCPSCAEQIPKCFFSLPGSKNSSRPRN